MYSFDLKHSFKFILKYILIILTLKIVLKYILKYKNVYIFNNVCDDFRARKYYSRRTLASTYCTNVVSNRILCVAHRVVLSKKKNSVPSIMSTPSAPSHVTLDI